MAKDQTPQEQNMNSLSADSLSADARFEDAQPQLDQAVLRGLACVPVPPDLESKLLAAVRAEAGPTKSATPTFHQSSLEKVVEPVSPPVEIFQNHEPAPRSQNTRAKNSWGRRRNWLALAGVLALAAIGGTYLNSATSQSQLADFCLMELERLESTDEAAWQITGQLQFEELSPALQRLVTMHRLSIHGLLPTTKSFRSSPAQAWKMSTRDGQAIVVLEFSKAINVRDLNTRFSAIRQVSGGGWSLAALTTEQHVLVLATRGNIEPFVSLGNLG